MVLWSKHLILKMGLRADEVPCAAAGSGREGGLSRILYTGLQKATSLQPFFLPTPSRLCPLALPGTYCSAPRWLGTANVTHVPPCLPLLIPSPWEAKGKSSSSPF